MKTANSNGPASHLTYAGLFDRVKAIIIDSLVVVLALYIVSDVLQLFDAVPTIIRSSIFLLLFALYEPLMTSFFGGTLGHKTLGLSVKSEINHKMNIPIHKALLRCLVKYLLGWISLLSISLSPQNLAIHDHLSGSVVLVDE